MRINQTDTIFTVESLDEYSYSQYNTYEDAETEARRKAHSNGYDVAIMGVVAIARKPVAVNTVAVEKV